MVKKVLYAVCLGTPISRLALVDGHAYDAWPALATFEARSSSTVTVTKKREWSNRMTSKCFKIFDELNLTIVSCVGNLQVSQPSTLCANVVVASGNKHSVAQPADAILERIMTGTYDACRKGVLAIPGFPDFQPLTDTLKECSSGSDGAAEAEYKVCSVHGSGALLLKESLMDQFAEMPGYEEIVADHNERFNSENLVLNDRANSQVANQTASAAPVACEFLESTVATAESLAALPKACCSQRPNCGVGTYY